MIFNEKAFLHSRERSLYKDLEILWKGYENQRKEIRISDLFELNELNMIEAVGQHFDFIEDLVLLRS